MSQIRLTVDLQAKDKLRVFHDPTSHAERAFVREEASIVGFGVGVGGMVIGNNRRGHSIMIQPKEKGFGSIGWGAL
jgi:hypothetical protein